MAWDSKPDVNGLLGSDYTATSTDFTFNLSDFDNLEASEIDASTGDVRKILYGFLQDIYKRWTETASADRPVNMTMTRGTTVNDNTGTATATFTLRYVLGDLQGEVANEPA